MFRLKPTKLPERLFALSIFLLVFGYGVAVGHFEVFPFSLLESGWTSVQQVYRERGTLLGTRPTEFLERARYPGQGVTRLLADRAVPGLTLMTGFFEGGNQLRLVQLDGTIVNKWPVAYYDLFSSTDHIQPAEVVPKTNWNAEIHGALALPDGSVLFNFSYNGAVLMDRCGRPQWTLQRMTHHAMSFAADGGFWIPSARYVRSNPPFPGLRPPYVEDTILKVSRDGKVVTEISIPEVLFRNNLQGLLFWKRGTGDMTHLNDVEELTPELAARFPMFAAGDLLLSMRMQHLVLVLDPATLRVKWYQAGPWIGQHDPDFTSNGKILLFNNNDDGHGGSVYGGSGILEIDPATRLVERRYGTSRDQPMFTFERGKQQELSDGHVLITEANAGRAFEVDKTGQIVWEFMNRYDDDDAALISEATRYAPDYFKVSQWGCPGR